MAGRSPWSPPRCPGASRRRCARQVRLHGGSRGAGGTPGGSPKRYAKLAVGHPMRWALSQPRLGRSLDKGLARVPVVDHKVRIAIYETRVGPRPPAAAPAPDAGRPCGPVRLGPRGRRRPGAGVVRRGLDERTLCGSSSTCAPVRRREVGESAGPSRSRSRDRSSRSPDEHEVFVALDGSLPDSHPGPQSGAHRPGLARTHRRLQSAAAGRRRGGGGPWRRLAAAAVRRAFFEWLGADLVHESDWTAWPERRRAPLVPSLGATPLVRAATYWPADPAPGTANDVHVPADGGDEAARGRLEAFVAAVVRRRSRGRSEPSSSVGSRSSRRSRPRTTGASPTASPSCFRA